MYEIAARLSLLARALCDEETPVGLKRVLLSQLANIVKAEHALVLDSGCTEKPLWLHDIPVAAISNAHYETLLRCVPGRDGLLAKNVPADFSAQDILVLPLNTSEQLFFFFLQPGVAPTGFLDLVYPCLALAASRLELISERNRTAASERAREAAEIANRTKSEFLANMSHDLRTPLNSMLGFTEIVRDGLAGDVNEEQFRQLDMVWNSSRHLLDLINEILDLAKIEAGKITINKSALDCSLLTAEIYDVLLPQAHQKGLNLEIDVELQTENLITDTVRIKQVLMNLISNAIKFTEEGSVLIRIYQENNDAILEVIDTGRGIDEKMLQKIFDPYLQLQTEDRETSGTGLGLAICRKLVELIGGEISVESVEHQGSTFQVRLFDAISPGIPMTSIADVINYELPESRGVNSCVLVVDDDENFLELMGYRLEMESYTVKKISDPRLVLEWARENQPIAITLDILMPGLNGWELLSQLKNDPLTSHIPVIMVSIAHDNGMGVSLGAVDYLRKPVDQKEILKALNRLKVYRGSVLVVDDRDSDARLLKIVLQYHGFDVAVAYNGKEALEYLEYERPDVILLDLLMPVMNGFEFLERLRLRERWSDIPVVVLSSKTLTASETAFLKANAEQIARKSEFQKERLVQEVRRALSGKRGQVNRDFMEE